MLILQFEEDVQATSKQRADLSYGDIERLAFSFKGLVRIDNLPGLSKLRELRLDNNDITKIENLSHLVSCQAVCVRFCRLEFVLQSSSPLRADPAPELRHQRDCRSP